MRDILRGMYVQSFQGYYYAKPIPQDECLAWEKEYDRDEDCHLKF